MGLFISGAQWHLAEYLYTISKLGFVCLVDQHSLFFCGFYWPGLVWFDLIQLHAFAANSMHPVAYFLSKSSTEENCVGLLFITVVKWPQEILSETGSRGNPDKALLDFSLAKLDSVKGRIWVFMWLMVAKYGSVFTLLWFGFASVRVTS